MGKHCFFCGAAVFRCKLIFVHGNIPSFSVAFYTSAASAALAVHCRVSPILCVHGHRETVTRHLYLDQSFIPLQRLYCCLFIIFFPVNTKLSVFGGSRLVAPSRFLPGGSPHTMGIPLAIFFLCANYTCRSSE